MTVNYYDNSLQIGTADRFTDFIYPLPAIYHIIDIITSFFSIVDSNKVCQDDTNVDCNAMEASIGICKQALGVKYCPVYCGKCQEC